MDLFFFATNDKSQMGTYNILNKMIPKMDISF